MSVECGIDEAGRGPLAGPVTAAAVVLSPDLPLDVLADSKKLSERQRASAAALIMRTCTYAVGWAWPEEIDRINILQASLLAMERAYSGLRSPCDLVLVDGPYVPAIETQCRAVVHGDALIPAIQAASIIAKVARDRWMIRYSWIDGRYGFDRHKGYPTREHRALCRALGPSDIHRKSFTISGGE